ncbi:hypothetical protein O5D80_002260 [Batrachochytrium dendrobatidis]|nr:hypothetical protein O5D80_002260 [Batrachochytrium dendrobatidis]
MLLYRHSSLSFYSKILQTRSLSVRRTANEYSHLKKGLNDPRARLVESAIPSKVGSSANIGVPTSFVLYTYPNLTQYYMLYGSGCVHMIFWGSFAYLLYTNQPDSPSSFLNTKVTDLVFFPQKASDPDTHDSDRVQSSSATPQPSLAESISNFIKENRSVSLATASAVACASVGIVFFAVSHWLASGHLSKIELVNGNTFRVRTCALIGKATHEYPLSSASLTRPLYTGIGPRGVDILHDTHTPWYRNLFNLEKPTHLIFDVASNSRKKFLVHRKGVFPNPQFLDRLITEKKPLSVLHQ